MAGVSKANEVRDRVYCISDITAEFDRGPGQAPIITPDYFQLTESMPRQLLRPTARKRFVLLTSCMRPEMYSCSGCVTPSLSLTAI